MLELFEVRMSVAELVVRGSAIFWFLFLIFRFVMRRDIGGVGVADVLLLVIVADASQNAMSGDYTTITEGFILVATIIGWNWLLDWLAFRYAWARRFAQAPRLLLIDAGKPQKQNLERQHLTVDDLEAKLRQQGVEHLADVKKAYLEGDGELSVIRYADAGSAQRRAAKKNDPPKT
ncbi:MAG TPA: YetF domain-containing protein [Steroidobacteraceae bacterium]|nr:YetF domain-containing protein [Steroidobacteraceae bacterium]